MSLERTDPTALAERLRARLVERIADHAETISAARRQIAALATRPDVQPQAMLGDLRSLLPQVERAASCERELRAMLEFVDQLAPREVTS
jgi:hypothetical protein